MIGIVYNPCTNKGASVERMKKIREELDSRGIQYEYRESTYAGESIVLAKELAETCDTLVSAGGDGTFFEVVNGTIDKDVTYAILPFGSGNDTSRTLGLYGKTDSQLIDTILDGKIVDFDCEYFNDDRVSMQFIAFGIVSEVLANFVKKKKSRGINYVMALLGSILKHRPKKYKVIIDGEEKEYLANMVAMMNIRTAGSGMMICPTASVSDRGLDLVIVEYKSRRRFLCNLIALSKGKLLDQPNVIHKVVTEGTFIPQTAEDCNVDGECIQFERVDIKLYPKQIKVKH